MENFNILISRVVNAYDGDYFQMINIKISIIKGKFPIRSLPEYVRVTDGINSVLCFMAHLSGNQKEINASFTTDAFDGFSGSVNIEFGYGGEITGIFESFDINNNIIPLDSIFSGANISNADNAWLQNHIDT